MGSFNTTCFASNQTIATGDKCRIVPIAQQSTFRPVQLTQGDKNIEQLGIANTSVGPDCYWSPQSGFLSAVYDDCGSVKLQLDKVTRANVLSFFSAVLLSSPKVFGGENEYHDVPFDFAEFLTLSAPRLKTLFALSRSAAANASVEGLDEEINACWSYITEVASEHRLFLRCNGRIRPLQFAVMHDRTYEALVAHTLTGTTRDGESLEQGAYIRRALSEAKEAEKGYLPNPADPETAEETARMRKFEFMETFRQSIGMIGYNARLPPAVGSALMRRLGAAMLAGTLGEEDLIARLLPIVNDQYAVSALDDLNIKYSPMVYAGQDYENGIGQDFATFVACVSKQVTRDRKIRIHGEYRPYAMLAPNQAALESLCEFIRENDSDIDDIGSASIPGNSAALTVTFTCPMNFENLRDLLEEFDVSELMVRSLTDKSVSSAIMPTGVAIGSSTSDPSDPPATSASRRNRP